MMRMGSRPVVVGEGFRVGALGADPRPRRCWRLRWCRFGEFGVAESMLELK